MVIKISKENFKIEDRILLDNIINDNYNYVKNNYSISTKSFDDYVIRSSFRSNCLIISNIINKLKKFKKINIDVDDVTFHNIFINSIENEKYNLDSFLIDFNNHLNLNDIEKRTIISNIYLNFDLSEEDINLLVDYIYKLTKIKIHRHFDEIIKLNSDLPSIKNLKEYFHSSDRVIISLELDCFDTYYLIKKFNQIKNILYGLIAYSSSKLSFNHVVDPYKLKKQSEFLSEDDFFIILDKNNNVDLINVKGMLYPSEHIGKLSDLDLTIINSTVNKSYNTIRYDLENNFVELLNMFEKIFSEKYNSFYNSNTIKLFKKIMEMYYYGVSDENISYSFLTYYIIIESIFKFNSVNDTDKLIKYLVKCRYLEPMYYPEKYVKEVLLSFRDKRNNFAHEFSKNNILEVDLNLIKLIAEGIINLYFFNYRDVVLYNNDFIKFLDVFDNEDIIDNNVALLDRIKNDTILKLVRDRIQYDSQS